MEDKAEVDLEPTEKVVQELVQVALFVANAHAVELFPEHYNAADAGSRQCRKARQEVLGEAVGGTVTRVGEAIVSAALRCAVEGTASMILVRSGVRVWLATGHTDMRGAFTT